MKNPTVEATLNVEFFTVYSAVCLHYFVNFNSIFDVNMSLTCTFEASKSTPRIFLCAMVNLNAVKNF